MIKKTSTLFSMSSIAIVGLLFVLTSISATALSDCNNLKGCEMKFCEMQTQIDMAEKKGNKHKVEGLKKALAEAKGNCSDKDLKKDLLEEIEENKKDLAEYEADLKEAKEYAKTDKIRKYEAKILEEQNEIKHLENELSKLD